MQAQGGRGMEAWGDRDFALAVKGSHLRLPARRQCASLCSG